MSGLTERLARLRAQIIARVRSVNETTTRETMAAARAVAAVVSVAHDQIAVLKRVVAASGDGELHASVSDLSSLVRTETTGIRDRLTDHHRRLEKAADRSRTIADAARKVDALTREARVLAINALIEAQRVRSESTGMSVIADEMQRLAKAIAVTNASIQELAHDLGDALPALSADSAGLVATCQGFAVTAADRIAAIDTQARALAGDVSHSISQADGALGRVVGESQSALSHLQYQDVCAQQLLEIDRWAHDLHAQCARDEGSAAPVSAPVQERLGDSGSDVTATTAAGDVVLF